MDEGDERRQRIGIALQLLAQREGVQRKDITHLLRGELNILARAWRLDLERGDDAIRLYIYEQVIAHLAQILEMIERREASLPKRQPKFSDPISPEARVEQFRRVVTTLFNVHPNRATAGGFLDTLLLRRYAWLDSDANSRGKVSYRIKKPAAEGDFKFAIGLIAEVLDRRLQAAAIASGSAENADAVAQIAQSLVDTASRDVDVIASAPEVPDASLGPRVDANAVTDEPHDAPSVRGPSSRLKRRVVLACGGVLVLVGGLIAAGKLTGAFGASTANAAPPATRTMQPPVVSSFTGPVMVTSTAYMRDGGTPGAWSYAFPQTLSSADVASYGAVSQNQQQYQQWAFGKGGVTTDDVRLQIGLRGNQNGTVVIQNIQVTKQCRAPLSGTLLYVTPQGGTGDLGIFFDLDEQFPVAEDADTHASYFGASGAGHTITLSHGEDATLLLDAVTDRQYCTFSLTLVIQTDAGQEVNEAVNDGGKPFQVTAAAGVGSSVPFSNYHAVYIQNGAEDGLIPVNPGTFGSTFSKSTASAGG